MKYIQNIKEYFFVVVIFYLALNITKNVKVIRELQVQVEQTKENLYQINQVIAEMQKDNYETFLMQNNILATIIPQPENPTIVRLK